MAEKHPYASGTGGIVNAVNQIRNAFPPQVTAETLKKLGIAPNNETYIINILRFVGVIDEDGNRVPAAAAVFSKHGDEEFQAAFEGLVKAAYKELFSLHGDKAWELPVEKLISFFRSSDQTSAIVGQRQATTFQTLAKLSGHGEPVKSSPAPAKKAKAAAPKQKESKQNEDSTITVNNTTGNQGHGSNGVGLTVRIEINLPAAGDQDTYDRIFKSIRENLLRGQS